VVRAKACWGCAADVLVGRPPSPARWKASSEERVPSAEPAKAGSEVVEAGMSATATVPEALPVAHEGPYIDNTKDPRLGREIPTTTAGGDVLAGRGHRTASDSWQPAEGGGHRRPSRSRGENEAPRAGRSTRFQWTEGVLTGSWDPLLWSR